MILVSITSMRNQEQNAKRIAEGYVSCVSKPDLCVFVLDRTTDNTQAVLESVFHGTDVKFTILKAPWDDSTFAAGRPRDWAIDQVRSYLMPSVECFVFLDGDCIPSPRLFAEHERIHDSIYPYPCLVNGSRKDEESHLGKVLPDPRQANPCVMSPGVDTVICAPENLYVDQTSCIPACWGCNISLNNAAVDTARILNKMLFNDTDRAFASCFDGNWGGEDPFLAATLFRVGALIVTADPKRSWVLHTWHDGAHRNNKHASVLNSGLRRLRLLLSRLLVRTEGTMFLSTGQAQSPYLVTRAVQVLQESTATTLPATALVLQLSRVVRAASKEAVETIARYKRTYPDNVVSMHVFELPDFIDVRNCSFSKPTTCNAPYCYWLTYSVNALC